MSVISKWGLSRDFKQCLMLLGLFFISSFVYNIMLPLKKTVIMYIPGAGAESMAYLKPFFITPGSFLFTAFFLKLSSHYDRHRVFRIILGVFTAYFCLYRFCLTPYRPYFVASSLASLLREYLPLNFQAAPPLVEYWMDTVFYTMVELWGTTIVSLMIWGFVNQTMTQEKAQSRYGIFTLGANSSAIASGSLSLWLGRYSHSWDQLFNSVLNVVLCGCVLTWVFYECLVAQGWLSEQAEPAKKVRDCAQDTAVQAPLTRNFSLFSSFQHVYRHQRLWAIAIIVLGYNTLYTLSDFMFTKHVELYFGVADKIQSNNFLAQVSLATGGVAIILALIVYPLSIRWGGWLVAALITPLFFAFTGCVFYGSQYMQFISVAFMTQGADSIPLLAGAIHVACIRGARYSVFDATKEAAYVGLSRSDQIQGKAAIDAIASRVGRSLGSVIFFVLFALLGNSIMNTLPYIMGLATVGVLYWVWSVYLLNTIRQKDAKSHALPSVSDTTIRFA